MAEFYLGPGGSENYDFEHLQVDGNKKVKVVFGIETMERQITKQRFGVSFESCEQSHQGNELMVMMAIRNYLQGIVNMYSDAWYWYTMHDWAR